jgi:hypothetical protein
MFLISDLNSDQCLSGCHGFKVNKNLVNIGLSRCHGSEEVTLALAHALNLALRFFARQCSSSCQIFNCRRGRHGTARTVFGTDLGRIWDG